MSRFHSFVMVLCVTVVLILSLFALAPEPEPAGSAMRALSRTGRWLVVACPVTDESCPLPESLSNTGGTRILGSGRSVSVLTADQWTPNPAMSELVFYSAGDEPILRADGRELIGALEKDHRLSWLLVQDVQWHYTTAMSCRLLPHVPAADLHREVLTYSLRHTSPVDTSPRNQPVLPGAASLLRPPRTHPSLGWEEPIVVVLTRPEPKIHVGLYSGRGAWEPGVQAIGNFLDHNEISWSSLDEDNLNTLDLENHFDVLWFPGGFSAEYRYYAGDHSRVRDFVAGGGGFIGICAGAYYASNIMNWQGGTSDYPLNLFAGRGVGPISGLGWGDPTSIELESEHEFNEPFDPVLDMYYMSGPYFVMDDSQHVDVLARYGINDEPAVITFAYGDGTVLLLGPHPELGYDHESASFNALGGDGAQWAWLDAVFRSTFLR